MSKDFNLDDYFVSVDSQEKGSAFEVISDAGEPTGMFITLAGPDSARRSKTHARVKDFFLSAALRAQKADQPDNRKARRAAAKMQKETNTGKVTAELRDLQMEDMIAATISWEFPDGSKGMDCTPENVEMIYTKHPTLFEHVLEVADDLDRFTKS